MTTGKYDAIPPAPSPPREDTGQHPQSRMLTLPPEVREKIDKITAIDVHVIETRALMTIAMRLFGIFAVSALAGVVWMSSTLVTLSARVDSLESAHHEHTSGPGHTETQRRLSDAVSAAAATGQSLADINRRLGDMQSDIRELSNRLDRR